MIPHIRRTTTTLKPPTTAQSMGCIISIQKGHEADIGIMAHELTHVKQWWRLVGRLQLIGTPSVDVPMLPLGLFEGKRAMSIQTYIESNIKNGTQFEASRLFPSVTASSYVRVLFKTGALPVSVKDRRIEFNGSTITARVYEGTVYTGGTDVTSTIFNMNRINPKATTVQIIASPATITTQGTEIAAPTYGIGSNLNGNATSGTYATNGAERILKPNTTYMLETQNTTIGTQDINTYITWYEGIVDLPR